ncbi:2-nitropropane dioxygenase [Mycena leptocephala]|nr:2-nitropropane dioxygenase [Mycena leptocephala]
MNMVGHPKHIPEALGPAILIPACVDAVKGPKSPFTGKPVYVIGAGAVYDGRGLAANLMWAAEAGCAHPIRVGSDLPPSRRTRRKSASCSAGFEDAVTTLIFTGRTPYIEDRNLNRQAEIEVLTGKGKLPHEVELEKRPEISLENRPWLMGRVSALINDMLPAQVIVDNVVRDAAVQLQRGDKYLNPKARL